MGIFSALSGKDNASTQSANAGRRAQQTNQAQAAQAAGRGSRRIGGGTSSRTKPSQNF